MFPHEQEFKDICLQCCPSGAFDFTYIIVLLLDFREDFWNLLCL